MRIGILTGGGDVPGLNPCIRSITLNADDLGWEVLGFRRGWEGVLAIDPADPASVDTNTMALTRRSEEHTSELQSLMRISYAVFCLKKKTIRSTENRSTAGSMTKTNSNDT